MYVEIERTPFSIDSYLHGKTFYDRNFTCDEKSIVIGHDDNYQFQTLCFNSLVKPDLVIRYNKEKNLFDYYESTMVNPVKLANVSNLSRAQMQSKLQNFGISETQNDVSLALFEELESSDDFTRAISKYIFENNDSDLKFQMNIQFYNFFRKKLEMARFEKCTLDAIPYNERKLLGALNDSSFANKSLGEIAGGLKSAILGGSSDNKKGGAKKISELVIGRQIELPNTFKKLFPLKKESSPRIDRIGSSKKIGTPPLNYSNVSEKVATEGPKNKVDLVSEKLAKKRESELEMEQEKKERLSQIINKAKDINL